MTYMYLHIYLIESGLIGFFPTKKELQEHSILTALHRSLSPASYMSSHLFVDSLQPQARHRPAALAVSDVSTPTYQQTGTAKHGLAFSDAIALREVSWNSFLRNYTANKTAQSHFSLPISLPHQERTYNIFTPRSLSHLIL